MADGSADRRMVVGSPCPDCGGGRFLVRQTDPVYARMTCATCSSSFEVPRSLVADTKT